MLLNELFDQKIPYEIDDMGSAIEGTFSFDDATYRVTLTTLDEPRGIWTLEFTRNSSWEKTAIGGNAFYLFSTIKEISEKMISVKNPNAVRVDTAKSEIHRLKLYGRFARDFVNSNSNYELEEKENNKYHLLFIKKIGFTL